MATYDHKPSRTKNPHNSYDETQKPCKRHKHRHHHHHHRSKNHEAKNVLEHVPPRTNTTDVIVLDGDRQVDYDMEEGEILDIGVDNNVKFDCSDHKTEEVSVQVYQNGKAGSGLIVLKEAKSDVSSRVSAIPVQKGEISLNTNICDGIELQRTSSVENRVNYIRKHQHGSRDSRVNDQILETSERNRKKSWEERDMEMQRKRSRRKEMARDKDRDRDKVRERDRVRDKERRDRERSRYRDGEEEGLRNSCCRKYQDDNIGDLDKYTDHMHQRLVDREYMQRSRTNEKEQIQSYETDYSDMDANLQETVMHIAEQEEEDLNRIKEESRRRRQAILEKYKAQQSQQKHELKTLKSEETVKDTSKQPNKLIGAAYSGRNKSADMFLDDTSFSLGMSPEQTLPPASKISGLATLGEGTSQSKGSDDMFCDDVFGDSPAGVRKQGKGAGLKIERTGNQDNWDDAEGNYKYRIEEQLDGRYEIVAPLGEGVFSKVVRASDLKAGSCDPETVAIKIIRSNDTMYKAGLEELLILKKLVDADPEDRQHCVRFRSSFKYNNHLCLVFESLDMNLRQYLKKVGCDIGLELTVVRDFAIQLFIALEHLKNCGVLHSDIKPDNMLVNEANTVLKLSDFGSAMFAGKNEVTPYLVSRFYRAPEIILGLSYDHPMDIWSVGCCLYEFYTGKVLFPGPSNNDMLRLHMELKGPFPKKMLRKGAFTHQHFDQDLNFYVMEEDPFTKKAIKRLIRNFEPKDFSTILLRFADDDRKMFANFKDLLDKIFVLNPDKRITVSQALSHPFITGK